ncbi:unnamed protein product [Lymnaea stagnalis]|uniref:Transport and Golgi organization protein 6 homolog n=1 Tax=Lymnaea stagnalis TaxID=6523 RepID=A0AAV2I248_LYMST
MAASINPLKSERIDNQLIFQSLTLLKAPAESKSTLSDGKEELLDNVLQENLVSLSKFLSHSPKLLLMLGINLDRNEKFINNDTELTTRQKFTQVCVELLQCLRKNLAEEISVYNDTLGTSQPAEKEIPNLPPGALSLQQESLVSTTLQFVLVLGMSPYLSPGIGIPVSHRLGPGQILLATSHDYTSELGHLQQIQFLLPVAKLLTDIFGVSSLQLLLVNSYLSDLITVLIQIRYCAKMVQKNTESQKSLNLSSVANNNTLPKESAGPPGKTPAVVCETFEAHPTEEIYVYDSEIYRQKYLDPNQRLWTLQSVINYANAAIDTTVRSSSTPIVIKAVLMLSGISKAGSTVKTPPWFRRTIACLLRDVLMLSSGVQNFICSFIGVQSSSTINSQDWQRCQAVAQIISKSPLTPNITQQFYTSVTKQLTELLQSSQVKEQPLVTRAVGATVLELYTQHPDLVQSLCLSHLHAPLLSLTQHNAQYLQADILVSEDVMTSCLECLHRLYVLGQEPQSLILSTLVHIVGVLFEVFIFAMNSASNIKTLCCDLIKMYLSHCDVKEAVTCLLTLTSNAGDPQVSPFPSLDSRAKLVWGGNGGVLAVADNTETILDTDSWTKPVDGAMAILTDVNSDVLLSQLFLNLLEKLTNMVTTETDHLDIQLPGYLLSPKQRMQNISELRKKISYVSFLASLGEKFGEKVIQSGHHVLAFTKATLERCIKICLQTDDEPTKLFEWETVSMAMGLLTAVLGGAVQLTEQDKKLLDDLLPLLTAVSESDATDPTVKEMAEDLKIAVATRGLVWSELKPTDKKKVNFKPPAKSEKKEKPKESKCLIQVLAETTFDESTSNVDSGNACQQCTILGEESGERHEISAPNDSNSSKIQQALQDLCDPLLPVRSHGLISLARLVDDREPDIVGKSEMLLKVFLENMTHTDSYVYLAAVNGLAALSDLNPNLVVPRLAAEFKAQCLKDPGSKSPETTLKVGEALVKATKRLGELTPHYRHLLLPAILIGCRHSDSLVRASSLSGLAEVCKLLRYAIGPVLFEIFTCCRDVISSDVDPEPRKAAVMTLTQLLQGLGKEALLALGDVLLEIYRALKTSLTHDPDVKVQLQAQLALNELDQIMRDSLFAKPELKKKITILGYQ